MLLDKSTQPCLFVAFGRVTADCARASEAGRFWQRPRALINRCAICAFPFDSCFVDFWSDRVSLVHEFVSSVAEYDRSFCRSLGIRSGQQRSLCVWRLCASISASLASLTRCAFSAGAVHTRFERQTDLLEEIRFTVSKTAINLRLSFFPAFLLCFCIHDLQSLQ